MKESILALLIGIGGTNSLGEKSPYYLGGLRIETQDFRIEGVYDSSDKIESPGYRISGSAIWKFHRARFGTSYSYRHTEAWNKDAVFLVIGAGSDKVELLFLPAINSSNNELKLELRIRLWKLELHSLYEYYNMTNGRTDKRFGICSQLIVVLP